MSWTQTVPNKPSGDLKVLFFSSALQRVGKLNTSKQQSTVAHFLILLFFIYPLTISPSSSSQTLINLYHNLTGRFPIFSTCKMKYEKVELWYFYLTPSCSFLQLSHHVSPSCAPKRCLTPGTWSQHLQYHKEQAMLWDFCSSFPLEFPTFCSSFSLSGGRGGALFLVSAVPSPPSSHVSAAWGNKVLSWKRDRWWWWLIKLNHNLVLQSQAEI